MRSIQRRFSNTTKKNPYLSSFMNFGRAVKGQEFSKNAVSRWFNKLVEKGDYPEKTKKQLVKHFMKLTNAAEEY